MNPTITNHSINQPNCHIPVLLSEVRQALFEPYINDNQNAQNQSITIFDGTLGGGGYTTSFLELANSNGINLHQISVDLDPTAIERVRAKIVVPSDCQLDLIQGNFADIIANYEPQSLDGITVDLGFSSNQLAGSNRGFAYLNRDEILDLRYDDSTGLSLSTMLNKTKNWQDLSKIIYEYSGEDLASKIAKKIMDYKTANHKKDDWTVGELVDVIVSVIPISILKKRNQILSRVWQSLRIWINDEFGSLNRFLPLALEKLKPGGRLAVVCFHSLEDKIVTKYFRGQCKPIVEDSFGNKQYQFKMAISKAITPTEQELTDNPRSRSATLRIIERI